MTRVRVIDRAADGKPRRWQAFDQFSIDASARRLTPEKFMEVPGKISRTGTQDYTAMELGLEGTNRTIRLGRTADEVFKPSAIASFEGKTLTSGHPGSDVTAETWRGVAVGDVCNVMPAGDGVHVGALLTFKDAQSIQDCIDGKDQLSCGYSFALDMTPGTVDGQACDGFMRDIQGNHVAHVWNARGGAGLRVADSDPTRNKETTMPVRRVIDSLTVEIADEQSASIIDRAIKAATDSATAATKERETAVTRAGASDAALTAAIDAHGKAIAAKDKEIIDLKKQIVTGDALDALVEERSTVVRDAKSILGDELDTKGKANTALRIAALEHVITKDGGGKATALAVLRGVEPSKADSEVVRYAFDAVVSAGATRSVEDGERAAREAVGRAIVGDGKSAGGVSVRKAYDDSPVGTAGLMEVMQRGPEQKRA